MSAAARALAVSVMSSEVLAAMPASVGPLGATGTTVAPKEAPGASSAEPLTANRRDVGLDLVPVKIRAAPGLHVPALVAHALAVVATQIPTVILPATVPQDREATIQKARASACKRFSLAPASRRVGRQRTGSGPAASPSTANPLCSAFAFPRRTNYVSTAV